MTTVKIYASNLILFALAILALLAARDFIPSPVFGGVAGGVLVLAYHLGVYRGKADKP